MERKKELLVRVYLIFLAFVMFAGIIIAKVVKTALVEGDEWRSKGEKTMKWMNVEGERGNIYDMNGNLLATSLPYFEIKVDLLTSSEADFNGNINGLAERLAEHFGKTSSQWKTELTQKRREGKRVRKRRQSGDNSVSSNAGYYPLLSQVSKTELELLKKFPLFNLGKYKGGLITVRKSRREKPYRTLASRTIGLDRMDHKVGLERSYDEFLRGKTSKRLMRRVPPGDTWLPVVEASDIVKERGSDVITTLDMQMQDIVQDELLTALNYHNAAGGVAILMEVQTGAIRAMTSLSRKVPGVYGEEHNDAVGSRMEPGSTFKLISSMAMLESGALDLDTELELFGGRKKIYDLTIYDSHLHGIRRATFKEAFAMSSNVGIGLAAHKIYSNEKGWYAFHDALEEMGVMHETGIEIYGEKRPYLKNPRRRNAKDRNSWSGTTVPWMAHGYELSMTPLQILSYYNAVANDGKMMKPYLVSEVAHQDGERELYGPRVKNEEIVSASTILKAQELLKAVAESGTARGLQIEGFDFAGKTGTTKLNYWKEDESQHGYNASFAGYFPAESPRYSMIVVVYRPESGDFYGARVAGPVFRNVMQRVGNLEGLRETKDMEPGAVPNYAHSGFVSDYKKVLDFIGMDYKQKGKGRYVQVNPTSNGDMIIKPKRLDRNHVPDVRGESLKDALFVLEEYGLIVESEGVGKVVKQSLTPGSDLTQKKIKVYLN